MLANIFWLCDFHHFFAARQLKQLTLFRQIHIYALDEKKDVTNNIFGEIPLNLEHLKISKMEKKLSEIY